MRGTPIVIEPKHIRGTPSLNIVNNNWIDCVSMETKETKLQQEEVFNSVFNIYELPLSGVNINTPLSGYTNVKDKNAYPVQKTLTRTNVYGAETYYYYKVSFDKKFRTAKHYPGLSVEVSVDQFENTYNVGFARQEAKEKHLAGAIGGFKRFNSVQDFETEFISGNQMKADSNFAIGFVHGREHIDICIILRSFRFAASNVRCPRLSFDIKIYLDTFVETPKTLRYRLNAAGQCVLAEDSFKPKYPYKHGTSEMIQSGATAINKYNNNAREPLSKIIANSLLYQWKRGKMTARMEVLNIQYYDISGNLAVDIKNPQMKQIFKPCDWVIPYIVEEQDGQVVKVPLIKKRNGEPMVFEIVGAEFRYDGEMTQYLKMVEVID